MTYTRGGEPAYPDSAPPRLSERSPADQQLRDEITTAIRTAEQDLGTAEFALGNASGTATTAESTAAACRSIAGSLVALTRLALIAAKVAIAELDQS